MSNTTLTQFKTNINFDAPDEQDVLRAIYFETTSTTPRGFLNVFSEQEVVQMWNSEKIWTWSQTNRDWLTQTVQDIQLREDLATPAIATTANPPVVGADDGWSSLIR